MPPAPWTNVIANPSFGCLDDRSRPWIHLVGQQPDEPANTVVERPGFRCAGRSPLFARRRDRRNLDTDTPAAWNPPAVTVRHGQGYSRYEAQSRHLKQEMTVIVPPQDPVKIIRLRLTNNGTRTRHLTATYFVEWVLGTQREKAAMRVVCERDAESGAIVAKNPGPAISPESWPLQPPVPARVSDVRPHGVSWQIRFRIRPAALERTDLAERFGPLLDPWPR